MSSFFRSFRKGSTDTAPDEAAEPATPAPPTAPPPPPVIDTGTIQQGATFTPNCTASSHTPDLDESKITVEDEPAEDPVRAELEAQVRERDASISALEKARQEKKEELAALQAELEQERLHQMKEALTHKIESERIKRQTAHTEERLRCLEADMGDKAAIHEYANLIKGVAPKDGVDSQYVIKLQSQLQKAVQKMERTNEQMKELEESSRQTVDSLSNEIAELVEERCQTELDLRKQMDLLQEQKKDMQTKYETRIRENLRTLEALRAKATSQVTIEELEEELEETDVRLEELHHIQQTQERTIEQLTKQLAAEGLGA